MSTIEQTDRESAAFYKAPRVSLADIEGAIAERYDMNARTMVANYAPAPVEALNSAEHPTAVLSVCLLVLKNGFTVIGKSAPASPDNFDADYGKKLAYEDAVRQLWPLMGFALKDRIDRDKHLVSDDTTKVVGLFDKKPVEQLQTPTEIIKILEDTLASARAGNMSAVGIASVSADRTASTVAWSDTGFESELLACIDILHYRRLKRILEE